VRSDLIVAALAAALVGCIGILPPLVKDLADSAHAAQRPPPPPLWEAPASSASAR
jgi:hypothetical protein